MISPTASFKSWVPEWVIRFAILLVVLPGIILFALSVSNVNAAAGYYGVSPNDIQYSLIILYGSMASFIVLESRFLRNIAGKEYLIISVSVLMITCWCCYITQSFFILLIFRFIQGMLTASTISITLSLMFSRLHNERAREIGYSVVYCVLLIVTPLTTLFTAAIIDAFNFNVVYKCAIYSYLPGALLMYIIMNRVRITRQVPLFKLDMPSFVLYAAGLCLIGYVLVYGQQYEWLDDRRIIWSIISAILLLTIFVIRQFSLKRPYLHLQVFKNRNFRLGALLLFIFYLCRGSFAITTSYMAGTLGLDPIHLGYLLSYNIAGIIVAVFISSRLILLQKPLQLIFIYGFILLLCFHVYMCFLFSSQLDAETLVIPLILQGLGAGMLMVPIILFVVSSSPAAYGNTGSGIGIFVRFLGFCSSIAFVNYFQLYHQSNHFNRFLDQVNNLNVITDQKAQLYAQTLKARGLLADQASKASMGIINKGVISQSQLRAYMDYYQAISCLLLLVILIIALFPSMNRTVINLRSKQPAPIAF